MPTERYLQLTINNQNVDLPSTEDKLGFKIDYTLEDPANFTSKQGADPQNITLPTTKNNDKLFNTFHNPQVEDLSPDLGAIMTSSISSHGSGWVVGEQFLILGYDTIPSIGEVTAVSGSTVTGYTLLTLGDGYISTSAPTESLTGSGVGLFIAIHTVYETSSFREYMPCTFSINGSNQLMNGYALLTDCNFTDKPESYDVTLYSANGQWVIDMQNVTLWDCVSKHTHTFTVATVEDSWTAFSAHTEVNDYVYAPVRYSQPFDGTTLGYQGDNCVNIYHLRPSISLYWLIQRAFNQIGYKVVSQFMDTSYFKGLVLPWVWGDFYDINSQLVQGVTFKAVGELPAPSEPPPVDGLEVLSPFGSVPFWSGRNSANASLIGSAGGSSWWRSSGRSGSGAVGGYRPGGYVPSINPQAGSVYNRTTNSYISDNGITDFNDTVFPGEGLYVFNGNGNSGGTVDHFNMNISNPPNGYDNFGLYSFDPTTGTMIYNFDPPASLAGIMTNISATFIISLYMCCSATGTGQVCISLEVVHIPIAGDVISSNFSILPSGGSIVASGTTVYPSGDVRYPTTPTNCNFTVTNLSPGDQLRFRVRIIDDGAQTASYGFFSGGYLNNNPAVIGVPSYTYNPITESFQFIAPNTIWSPLQSSLNMTGFLIQLGNTVSFQNYDAFRNFNFLDLLGGTIDTFNLEVQSDNINKIVTIEPMFGSTLPTGETATGYFLTDKILDWTNKRDYSKASKMSLYNSTQRQLDLTFKLDGSDSAQNIWSQRYKGIYLGNRTYTGGINQNNIDIDNGIIAGIPGAARYMLPNRFAKGNSQLTNRFFSAVMHCPFPQWNNVNGTGGPTPQLICMFPENATGDSAISQAYTPKLAYYGGDRNIADIGGWIWIGDPATPYSTTVAKNFRLPFMFAVNYVQNTNTDPVLSYTDENINNVKVPGLLTQFYLQRFAIMRNGQMLTSNIRLNLNDITNWEHQESIMIDGCLYALIQIDGYDPLTDDSTACTMWKIVLPEQVDKVNTYPSAVSVLTSPAVLAGSYDLRYARLLLYPTDLPQIS